MTARTYIIAGILPAAAWFGITYLIVYYAGLDFLFVGFITALLFALGSIIYVSSGKGIGKPAWYEFLIGLILIIIAFFVGGSQVSYLILALIVGISIYFLVKSERASSVAFSAPASIAGVSAKSKEAQTWNDRAFDYYKKEQHGEAAVCMAKAIELDPYNENLWNNLGIILTRMGKYEEARDAYYKALSLNPNFEKARKNVKDLNLLLAREETPGGI